MAYQPVPDTVRVDFEYTQTDAVKEYMNTFYFRDTTVGFPTVTDLENLADDMEAWWAAEVAAISNEGVRLDRIVLTDQAVENGLQVIRDSGAVGTRVGADRAPISTAALVQWRGDPGGLPKKGWSFHYGALDSDQGVNGLAPAFKADVQAAYDALRAAPTAVSTALVLVSRYSKADVPVEPHRRVTAVTNTISTVAVRDVQGIQGDRRF